MGIRTLCGYEHENSSRKTGIMYCSTTDWAFGPVFSSDDDHDADERIDLFLEWLRVDARSISESELSLKYSEFLSKEKELWYAKEQALKEE